MTPAVGVTERRGGGKRQRAGEQGRTNDLVPKARSSAPLLAFMLEAASGR